MYKGQKGFREKVPLREISTFQGKGPKLWKCMQSVSNIEGASVWGEKKNS